MSAVIRYLAAALTSTCLALAGHGKLSMETIKVLHTGEHFTSDNGAADRVVFSMSMRYSRRATRVPCSTLFVVQVMGDGILGPCHTAFANNISRYGLRLQMDGVLPPEAIVELTPRDINMPVLATIRYVYECADGWLLGLAFSGFEWTDRCGWPDQLVTEDMHGGHSAR
jgi:hypothetical protein